MGHRQRRYRRKWRCATVVAKYSDAAIKTASPSPAPALRQTETAAPGRDGRTGISRRARWVGPRCRSLPGDAGCLADIRRWHGQGCNVARLNRAACLRGSTAHLCHSGPTKDTDTTSHEEPGTPTDPPRRRRADTITPHRPTTQKSPPKRGYLPPELPTPDMASDNRNHA